MIVFEGIAHDEDVVPATEGVLVDCARYQICVRVAALGLASRAAVEVPLGQIYKKI